MEAFPDAQLVKHRLGLAERFSKFIDNCAPCLRPFTGMASMVIAGVRLRWVQILPWHANYATTEKYYAHLTPEGDDGKVAKPRY